MRVRLELAYLGTRFEGWQLQDPLREGLPPRTVQGELEAALLKRYAVPIRAHGAGRTDAGVHAEAQVAHFDLPDGAPAIPLPGLVRGLNTALPEDVRVTSAAEAAPDFHARFSAAGKVYVYRLRRGDWLHPHRGLVEALAREPLDVAAMRAAAAALVGERDFAPFSVQRAGGTTSRFPPSPSGRTEAGNTVRRLARLTVEEEGSLLVVTATGDGFLRGMVRRLVGTLREAGRGRLAPEHAVQHPGPTAEARGLTLQRVLYPPG